MDTVYIQHYNESHLHVSGSDNGIEAELSEFFKFRVKGYQFMPQYRRGLWSGDIKLYDIRTKLIYRGLFENIVKFCEERKYKVDYSSDFADCSFSLDEAIKFINTLELPMEPRDYQIKSFVDCIRKNRAVVVSPTGSGKSLLIYMLTRFYNLKTLIIVPTTGLIHQMVDDFQSYGYKDNIHKIHSGKEKDSNDKVFCSTWQSIHKMPRNWFQQFDCVICDEAHLAKAASITKIISAMTDCKYKFGLTGSLDGTQISALQLTGLFGPILHVTTTSQLIENKILADFKVKCLVLHYSDEQKQITKSYDYAQELDFLVTHQKRNQFISKLATSIAGNTLVLFQFVEKHGKQLYELIKNSTDRPVYFIHGKVEGEERNDIRALIEQSTDAIIVASVQVFSTGINIKNLSNVIFASPSKSRVRTLQSIGRVLRKSETKLSATLFDIADNLQWKRKKNYTLIHFFERIKIYQQEQFPYKTYNVEIKTNE